MTNKDGSAPTIEQELSDFEEVGFGVDAYGVVACFGDVDGDAVLKEA